MRSLELVSCLIVIKTVQKTLFSSMQSVISLMREVELEEQAAEQAKVEAAMGGSDILVKSEELKEMVQQAEEANAMVVFLFLIL